jgi:hypothetical protein
MANYTIVNGTDSVLADVNAALDDIPARSIVKTVALDSTELAAVLTVAGVAVFKDLPTYQERRNVARIAKYRKSVDETPEPA